MNYSPRIPFESGYRTRTHLRIFVDNNFMIKTWMSLICFIALKQEQLQEEHEL